MIPVVLVMSLAYALYLVLGGVIFMHLEYEIVQSTNTTYAPQWILLKDTLQFASEIENATIPQYLLDWIREKCLPVHSLIIQQNNETDGIFDVVMATSEQCEESLLVQVDETKFNYPWSFLDSLYFSMTVATTIGFGHISPSKKEGRIACIIYAVIGIPFTMILLSRSSDFFGELLFGLFTSKVDKQKQGSKMFIALGTVFYIMIGFVVFIFFPAFLFTWIEDWSYFESVYYAFITLTTIGFGDFVTGKTAEPTGWLFVYQISVIIWIMCGLGYWVMVANFIMRALQSKKITLIAKKASQMIKMINPSSNTQVDPEYLMSNSKASMAFMIQLANALTMQTNDTPNSNQTKYDALGKDFSNSLSNNKKITNETRNESNFCEEMIDSTIITSPDDTNNSQQDFSTLDSTSRKTEDENNESVTINLHPDYVNKSLTKAPSDDFIPSGHTNFSSLESCDFNDTVMIDDSTDLSAVEELSSSRPESPVFQLTNNNFLSTKM